VEQSLYLSDLFTFFDVRPRVTSRPGARPGAGADPPGLRVSGRGGFRYPGSDRWAVRHSPSRSSAASGIALVGENGAGKTTLGEALRGCTTRTGPHPADGVDLRDYELGSLRTTSA